MQHRYVTMMSHIGEHGNLVCVHCRHAAYHIRGLYLTFYRNILHRVS